MAARSIPDCRAASSRFTEATPAALSDRLRAIGGPALVRLSTHDGFREAAAFGKMAQTLEVMVAENKSSPPTDPAAGDCALTEEQALQLIAFLTSAAEISIHEPTYYGTFRLTDAASRLIGFMLEHETPRSGAFLRELKDEIDTKKVWMMWDREAYFDFLRSVPGLVAVEVKRRADEDAARHAEGKQ